MNAYFDVRVLPDPEFISDLLMDALFTKLHRTLVMHRETAVGVSFPNRNEDQLTLGTVLRLHGDDDRLHTLIATLRSSGMRDHVALGPVTNAPASAGAQCVQRVQPRPSSQRLVRRQLRRHGGDEASLLASYADLPKQQLNLPSLSLRSSSTGQAFRLFIRHIPVAEPTTAGGFNHYGLSLGSSVPAF